MLTLAGLKTTARLFGAGRMVDFPVQTDAIGERTPEEILAQYRENIAKVDAYAAAVRNLNITIYYHTFPPVYLIPRILRIFSPSILSLITGSSTPTLIFSSSTLSSI